MATNTPPAPVRCTVCGALALINDDDVPDVAYCSDCWLKKLQSPISNLQSAIIESETPPWPMTL